MGYFTSEKLNESVTRILCPRKVYAYLVEGQQEAALIDTGYGVGSLKEYVESLTKLPYVVLLTHGHLDHAGGAGEFEQVYMNEKDLQLAKRQTTLETRVPYLCNGDSSDPDIREKDFIPPLPLEKYVPLQDGESFDLGGVTVTMLAMPGHTEGSMCALVNEARAILFGDACNSFGFLQFPESSSLQEYRDSLIAFRRHAELFDEVWYSHPHNFGDKSILEQTIVLCEEILSGKREGIPVEQQEGQCIQIRMAKPTDEHDRPLDGSFSNFLYKSEIGC